MSRLAVLTFAAGVLTACTACNKSAANQEPAGGKPAGDPMAGGAGGTKIAVPGAPTEAAPPPVKAGDDSRFRLRPAEGQLAIEVPADAKPNTETTVKVVVTPSDAYKVNTEFPTKLTLESPTGVTLAKTELKAGGHDKARGDADVFDEHHLVFPVKLTATAAGTYTVNGVFKFAVCDKAGSTCLAKKEPIAIQLAAN